MSVPTPRLPSLREPCVILRIGLIRHAIARDLADYIFGHLSSRQCSFGESPIARHSAGRFTPSSEVLLAAANAQRRQAKQSSASYVLAFLAARPVRRELPSIYPFSSCERKCVGDTEGGFSLPRTASFLLIRGRPVRGQAAKFCKKTLHSLPNSIRCDGIRFGNFSTGVAVQFAPAVRPTTMRRFVSKAFWRPSAFTSAAERLRDSLVAVGSGAPSRSPCLCCSRQA